MTTVITICVGLEGDYTNTEYETALTTRLTFFTFFNSALQSFLIQVCFTWYFLGIEAAK